MIPSVSVAAAQPRLEEKAEDIVLIVRDVLEGKIPEEVLLENLNSNSILMLVENPDTKVALPLLFLLCTIDIIKPDLFKKIWDRHLDQLTFEEWFAPVGTGLILCSPLVCIPLTLTHFPLIWNKFRSLWTAELLWKKSYIEAEASASFGLVFLTVAGRHKDQVVVREVWQMIKQDLSFQDLIKKDSNENIPLNCMAAHIPQLADIFDEVWQRFGSQVDEKILTSGSPHLFALFVSVADSHPKYLLEVWEKVPAGWPARCYSDPFIAFIARNHPHLLPQLVRRLNADGMFLPTEYITSELLLTKDGPHSILWEQLCCTPIDNLRAIYTKFRALIEKAADIHAHILRRLDEHDKLLQMAQEQLFIFSDEDHSHFKKFSKENLHPLLDAQLLLSKTLATLEKQEELSAADIDKASAIAQAAQNGGYLNAFYDLAQLFEATFGPTEEVLDLYAKVPATSSHHSAVVAKLQTDYFALTTARPRADSKKLLKKSVRYALQLKPIAQRDMAIQEIASSYIGANSAGAGINRALIPKHLLGLISPKTGPSWLFTVFDDIKEELALRARVRLLKK